jgi:hypothetical protein
MSNDGHLHARNIGIVVLHLARHHDPGDHGDNAVNDPIVNIIDQDPAGRHGMLALFLRELAKMSRETAAGIACQVDCSDDDEIDIDEPWYAPHVHERLAHYASRPPTHFRQIDGHLHPDAIMGPDADGHSVNGSLTVELMAGADVRVLVPLTTSKADAVTLLRKAIAWIERGAFEIIDKPSPGARVQPPPLAKQGGA